MRLTMGLHHLLAPALFISGAALAQSLPTMHPAPPTPSQAAQIPPQQRMSAEAPQQDQPGPVQVQLDRSVATISRLVTNMSDAIAKLANDGAAKQRELADSRMQLNQANQKVA